MFEPLVFFGVGSRGHTPAACHGRCCATGIGQFGVRRAYSPVPLLVASTAGQLSVRCDASGVWSLWTRKLRRVALPGWPAKTPARWGSGRAQRISSQIVCESGLETSQPQRTAATAAANRVGPIRSEKTPCSLRDRQSRPDLNDLAPRDARVWPRGCVKEGLTGQDRYRIIPTAQT